VIPFIIEVHVDGESIMKRPIIITLICLIVLGCRSVPEPDLLVTYDDYKEVTVATLKMDHFNDNEVGIFLEGSKYIREIKNGTTQSMIYFVRIKVFDSSEGNLDKEAFIKINNESFPVTINEQSATTVRESKLFSHGQRDVRILTGKLVIPQDIAGKFDSAQSISYRFYIDTKPYTVFAVEREILLLQEVLAISDTID
jgi:hypothetical protein